ncbi:hypothetical protein RXV94_12950 [Yeosuana sp. MJ-SS3]|jgi:hypothetical protein|uniref:HNH endonuclease n=1 Tax=Gilvirhabdus luticola TaxID=3079858 RepID=A0ABU3U9I5_9FLAO|nr:hypothetical protein [Yeosuana sp. MJ-SS3]MDU8887071.1 hypothetical protein [Yeosuana sp. MJ-SS3]
MNLTKSILKFLKKSPNHEHTNSPEGFCPNCWGRQEYGGNFYKALKSKNIKDLEQQKGWITSYVEQNLKAIHLKPKDKTLLCNVCFESYNH